MKRTFIGTGLIGSALAEASLSRGDEVCVWNRTVEKAEPLLTLGATLAPDLASAATKSDLIHLALTSDDAVNAVLDQIMDSIGPNTTIIDHSTTSPEGARSRSKLCEQKQISYLQAPVFMSPESCRKGTGVMVISGQKALYNRHQAHLSCMTGSLFYAGEEAHLAAAYKLVGNGLILAMLGGLSDVFAIAKNHGISAPEALGLFEHFDPTLVLKGRGSRMAEGDLPLMWTLAMARKDLGLMVDAAGDNAPLAALPGIGARMDQLIAEGEGQKDVGILARDSLQKN